MITYEKIVQTISEILNNELIYKTGLILIYELDEETHAKLDEHFFYKLKQESTHEHTNEFKVSLGGISIIFKIKK